jgi:tRNA pseudouridine38-40 synthase
LEGELERNHRMELQYDGTGLHGWAKQEGLSTVEGCLEGALHIVLGQAPRLRVAGRTDAGVHARRQVVSLLLPAKTDLARLRASLNALTPAGIAVTGISPAPEGFDARRNATSRSYRYFLWMGNVVPPFWSRYCWQVPQGLDPEALAAAAAAVEGRHDFTAFTPAESEHMFFERLVLRCRWRRVGRGFVGGAVGPSGGGGSPACLEIEGESFLRHMVRALVGTMLEVGEGTRDLEGFRLLLRGASREAAGFTAPPQGLFLWDAKFRSGTSARESDVDE